MNKQRLKNIFISTNSTSIQSSMLYNKTNYFKLSTKSLSYKYGLFCAQINVQKKML